jgi:acyl transferase domain-containing protein
LHLHDLVRHRLENYLVIPRNTPWTSRNGRLVGGISSFGFSGTNVHMILENAQASDPVPNPVERPAHIFTLSAKTEAALHDLSTRFEQYLETNPSEPIADVCYTTNVGRAHSKHRVAIVGSDLARFVWNHQICRR